MKIKDILAIASPNVVTVICESNGKVYYTGEVCGTYAFENLEIERLNAVNNQLIITIQTNDMQD